MPHPIQAGELSRSPHSPGDAVATPQVVIVKCPSENRSDSVEVTSTLGFSTKLSATSPEQLLFLYQTQVRSCIEYCRQLWDGSAMYQLDSLDPVDRRAKRLIANDLAVSRLQSLKHCRKVFSL
ncbi:jg2961 [Pararge aegeria aegeria]|uniref:Jg2961 protein n=1 Tax=Pararge aegeria aegeria TaxID=348720 RepID=A0A8S4R640_9NEOP|nr:jg2961 [Pararge aegeria aegeria]